MLADEHHASPYADADAQKGKTAVQGESDIFEDNEILGDHLHPAGLAFGDHAYDIAIARPQRF